jgi:hypothetical protein
MTPFLRCALSRPGMFRPCFCFDASAFITIAIIAATETTPVLETSCRQLGAVKLTRFRGHRTVCVQGVHDGQDEIALRS